MSRSIARIAGAVLALNLVLTACVRSVPAGPAAHAGDFRYDRRQVSALQVSGTETRNGVAVHDVAYAVTGGETVRGYLVVPAGGGRHPAVIYTHPAPGTRATYLDEAVALAGQGVVSLVLDAPWSRREWWTGLFQDGGRDRDHYTRVVVGLRRAVDVLSARPEVDRRRIGYVGHSFGASFGGVLVAVEPRIRAAILIAGPPSFTDIAAVNNRELTGDARARYAALVSPVDPVHNVGRAAGRPVLFQLPRQDELFSAQLLESYAAAAGQGKEVRWYEGDHYLKTPAARDDRIAWLLQKL